MKEIHRKMTLDRNCKYSMVMAVAKRAKELRRAAKESNIPVQEMTVLKTYHAKPLTIAQEEYIAGIIGLKLTATIDEPKNKKESEDDESQPAQEDTIQAQADAPQKPEEETSV